MANGDLGLTIQSRICEAYDLIPCEAAQKQFLDTFNSDYIPQIDPIILSIFSELGKKPVKCTTFQRNEENNTELIPYNFILSTGETLSIRTSKTTNMVAPRVVGQAGFPKFNEKFKDILKTNVVNQEQIRKCVFEKIHLMFPVFIKYTFNSDYLIWIYNEDGILKYSIFETNQIMDINFQRDDFTFTRGPETWTESTTIKYKNISIAESQTHKNRSFKFRFNFKNLISVLIKEKENNETIGITAEKVICDLFDLKQPESFNSRFSKSIHNEIKPIIVKSFEKLPKAIKHTGSDSGIRNGTSKCSYDFLLQGNKTLSVKTNIGKMVCPPEVGQPNDTTFYHYFKKIIPGDHIDEKSFKKLALNKVDKMMPIYMEHLFDSDYLLRIFKKGGTWHYEIITKLFGINIVWERSDFSFTKNSIAEWNESNTVKYRKRRLGEFQYHNNRNCYKFRFDFDNLIKIINDYEKELNKNK